MSFKLPTPFNRYFEYCPDVEPFIGVRDIPLRVVFGWGYFIPAGTDIFLSTSEEHNLKTLRENKNFLKEITFTLVFKNGIIDSTIVEKLRTAVENGKVVFPAISKQLDINFDD